MQQKLFLVLSICLIIVFNKTTAQNNLDYIAYHKSILKTEGLIAKENYKEAQSQLSNIITSYDFIFLRTYKLVVQLALLNKDYDTAFKYLKLGFASGLELKTVKKEPFLKPLFKMKKWAYLKKQFPQLKQKYLRSIDQELRKEVFKMYKKDQRFAMKYLFKIGQKAKERYGNKKGIPHTMEQMASLKKILESSGYPGEQLIGNNYWMSTILSHHNSISENFVKNDIIYPNLRPRLLIAISKGQLSPYDFAIIEDWRMAVKSNRQETGYGYIDNLESNEIDKSNKLRNALNIRSTELRNRLIDIQDKTGMNLYLAGGFWLEGKIGMQP
jgi:hypothetical protein